MVKTTRQGSPRIGLLGRAAIGLLGMTFSAPVIAVAADEPSDPDAVMRWAVEISSAAIGDSKTLGLLHADFDLAEGDAGGWVHQVGGSYVIHEFDWGKNSYHPHFATMFGIGLLDEKGSSTSLSWHGSLVFRWRDFPWNEHVVTTVAVVGGLSYFSEHSLIDVLRHPDDKDRSHLKFHARLELTFAPPSHPEHEVLLFNDHWSGGHVFDEGGWDTFGIGYRRRF